MITRCNHCGSKFEVSADIINSNNPSVRCGDCLSLFDARANLYNEAEYRKNAATLKPVQKSRRVEEVAEAVDSDYLETADTVAVEHIYTSAGVKNRTHGVRGSSDSSAYESARSGIDPSDLNDGYKDGLKDGLSGSNNGLGYQSESRSEPTEQRPDKHPEYRAAEKFPDDLEFERTLATESSLPSHLDVAGTEESNRQVDRRLASGESYFTVSRPGLKDQQAASRKQQTLREREQRALQMEPARDFESLNSIDIALDQNRREELREEQLRLGERRLTRSKEGRGKDDQAKEGQARRYRNERTRIDDRDLARDSSVVSRGDTHFIPDDVLNRPAILRDNGRRSEKATRFKPDTPDFDIPLDDNRSNADTASKDGSPQSTEKPLHQKEYATDVAQDRRHRLRDSYDDLHSNDVQHQQARDADNYRDTHERASRDERSSAVSETSAQEMRRFSHYRPSVEVEAVDDDLVVQSAPRTITQRRTGAGALFWMAGLLVAIGLLLFAARGVIANMKLPEPVITVFCQVTGCIPDQAKKDVSQLQTMRKRLYPHPEIENALVISVDVINNSIYKQPLPTLAVSLLGVDDNTVAERDFASADYEVVDGSESGYLMPSEPTRIMIEVVDTGLAAADVVLAFE